MAIILCKKAMGTRSLRQYETTHAMMVTSTHKAEYATKLCNAWARFPIFRMVVSA